MVYRVITTNPEVVDVNTAVILDSGYPGIVKTIAIRLGVSGGLYGSSDECSRDEFSQYTSGGGRNVIKAILLVDGTEEGGPGRSTLYSAVCAHVRVFMLVNRKLKRFYHGIRSRGVDGVERKLRSPQHAGKCRKTGPISPST
jgi:hypothetical protein